MRAEEFLQILGIDFFTGVPDSLLAPLSTRLMARYGTDPRHHIIAPNEGNAAAIAAGYHLATGKVACVYLQNSGEGNIVNPVASLLHPEVYAIPALFVIGWRGEMGVKDEPQHRFQGRITEEILQILEMSYTILEKQTTAQDFANAFARLQEAFAEGRSAAILVRKGALTGEGGDYEKEAELTREEMIESVLSHTADFAFVSTTGKMSRELFELRERRGEGHGLDFLTVGSMGHASSIALGIALQKPERKICCLDGDGAALMHAGAMPMIGALAPKNLLHIIVNNGAHESVGGLPTAAQAQSFAALAEAAGYPEVYEIWMRTELEDALVQIAKSGNLGFIEAHAKIGSRADLGRPTKTTFENKAAFMTMLK